MLNAFFTPHKTEQPKHYGLLILFSLITWFPFLGGINLFDWDEINFAECAREMIELGNYLQVHINYLPFWEKPPLFFWLQAGAMQLFGINDYAARFPNAVCNTLSLIVLYRIGTRLKDTRLGLLWAMMFGCSILPHFYGKSGIIDPWFNLFIFLGIHNIITAHFKHTKGSSGITSMILAGLFTGLAILTKGPVAALITGLAALVFWLTRRLKPFFTWQGLGVYFIAVLVPVGLWFGVDILKNGLWFTETFITYQIRLFTTGDAGHAGFPGYHFVVLLLGCFPASIIALPYLFKRKLSSGDSQLDTYASLMAVLFWVVLILFTIVKTKIIHYSSMCYLPLSFVAAYALEAYLSRAAIPKSFQGIMITTIGVLLCIAPILVVAVGNQHEFLSSLATKDPFAAEILKIDLGWQWWQALPAAVLLILLVGAAVKGVWKTFSLKPIVYLSIGTVILLQSIFYLFMGKIDEMNQGAYIRFLESLQGKDVHVITFGFRSYAPYYYSRMQAENKPTQPDPKDDYWAWREHLMFQPQSKAVYVVSKVSKRQEIAERFPMLQELHTENGWVFYVKR